MGGSSTHTTDASFAGIPIQTSLLGNCIPLGWGRGKLSCNLIDYLAFKAHAHTTTQGGKGGGSSSQTSYTYTASVIMALCEGPVLGIVTVYKDSGTYGSLASTGLSLALGSTTQTPWPYLTSLYPSHALSYPGIVYAYASDYALGDSASLANHSYEIDFGIQLGGGVHDADPKDILTDLLTNDQHGVTGWPSGLLGDMSDYSLYCRANNLLLSPVLDQQQAASDFVKTILQQTNSDCFWSEGVLKIKPFGDAAATANGVTWTPNLAPIFDLTEDDFLTEVQLEIVDQSDAYNSVSIEFLDRANQYEVAVAPANDLDNIVTYGLRKQDPQQFHHICDAGIAKHVAQLWLQRNLYIRDNYHFDLPMDFIGLEPMDYVTLTTTVDGMVLNRQLVMITSIDEDEDGQDILHIVAEGIPGATASAALYPAHTATSFAPAVTADPGNVATPLLINAPTSLTASGYEAWAAVCGTNPAWGGANVWLSFDDTNYTEVGTITAPGTFGVLTAALASHADPDTTNTLSVDLTASAGTLPTVTHAEADGGATLCLIGSEIVAYGTATLTAANKYDCTYLRRGQRGSAPGAHAIGDQFVRLDTALFKYVYPKANAGGTIYVKFQSFNIYGRMVQDLSTVTAYSLALSPAIVGPDPVTGLMLAGAGGTTWSGASLDIVWQPSARATSYRVDIYKADGTTLVRSITTAQNSASYSAAQAALDGAQREYKIDVIAINSSGSAAPSTVIDVTNAQPSAVSSPAASGGTSTGTVTCAASTDPDLGGYAVFYSGTSGFDPSISGGVVRSGIPSASIFGLAAGTYYARIAAYDGWSSNPALLNLSAELSFTITTGGGSTPSGGGTGGGGYIGIRANQN